MSKTTPTPAKSGYTPKEGAWDFDGACAPSRTGYGFHRDATFSLGIFRWIPASRGGIKRGSAQHRVSGHADDFAAVYAAADAYCAARTAGASHDDAKAAARDAIAKAKAPQ